MRYFVFIFAASLSFALSSQDLWHGICVVERDTQRVCSAYYPRSSDYANICNAFAQEQGASLWTAQFFSTLEYLRASIPDYCDQVLDGTNSAFYGCQTEATKGSNLYLATYRKSPGNNLNWSQDLK